jgi:hypothetical protein
MSRWVSPFGFVGNLLMPLTLQPCKSSLRPYESRKYRPCFASSGSGPIAPCERSAAVAFELPIA